MTSAKKTEAKKRTAKTAKVVPALTGRAAARTPRRALTAFPDSREKQSAAAKELRSAVPRSQLATLKLPADRDPLAILVAQNKDRLQSLLPLRRQRMAESPFAFFRGAAAVMASDLAQTPATGLQVAIGGDAHLSNFGLFASRDRDLVFDLNDFDEAAVGPWEWDLKRLVTSVVILGQDNAMNQEQINKVALKTTAAYRNALAGQASASALDRYYSRISAQDVIAQLKNEQKQLNAIAKKASKNTSQRALKKLAHSEKRGKWTITDQPPLTTRLPEFNLGAARTLTRDYLRSVPPDVAELLTQFKFQDGVLKVVGVGSVGTRCLLALLTDADGNPLFLQIKEATTSVIEKALGNGPRGSHGGRVVAMQKILQSSGDPFLGEFTDGDGRAYYVRQFRDMKGGVDIATLTTPKRLTQYATICATALARAHSQTGLAPIISAYLGSTDRSNVADSAIADFAFAYSEVNRADHQALLESDDAGWGSPSARLGQGAQ